MNDNDVRQVIEAAGWAPSVHNTQPWWFGPRGSRISLHADVERRLEVADPDGREMVISCGAALFTVRIAVRKLGYEPVVHLLPDPDRPGLIADVSLGRPEPAIEDVERLFAQVRRRRTHRGAFRSETLPASLLPKLRVEATLEGATLRVAVDTHTRTALAALTEAAEHVQRLNPRHVSEAARWAPVPGSSRRDGIHEGAYRREPERTEPYFPGRDFARGHGWGTERQASAGDPDENMTGLVAIVTTAGDDRADWLRAGQALQRILLRACAEEDVSAAFHTQALEVPELREFIRTRFCAGEHPQMLLRLGVADSGLTSVRRPPEDVTRQAP
ncbi:hypothetical protein HKK72_28410 [Actinomadura sp. HBU206391]|nr:hypothetical protein [Actinomadura sp. HBU206391]